MRKHGIETRKETEYNCDYCSTTFSEYPSQVTSKDTFCSMECQRQWQKTVTGEEHPLWEGGEDTLICDQCGDSYQKYSSKIRWGHQFCSLDCTAEFKEARDDYLYYGKNWKSYSDKAREESGGVCQRKGCDKERCDNGAKLHVHHLTPAREFDEIEDAHDSDNLVVLCAKHHQRIEAEDEQRKLIET